MNGERAKERILVVDDEPTVVRMCAKALSRQGYQVSEAGRGREALVRLEEERFDLLLLDLLLPDVDGLTVLRQARELDPHVTAVIITGYGTIETAVNALRAGARGFLLKPFESGELLQAVDEALAERRQEQENLLLRARLPILEISQALMAEEDVGSLAGQLLETVVRQVEADRAALMLLDEQTDELRIVGTVGLPAGVVDETRAPVGQGIARQVFLREEPLVVDGKADLDPPLRSLVAGADTHVVCVPLRTRKEAIGVLVLSRSSERAPFTPSDLDLLSIVGNQIAIALENARLFDIVARGKREWETTFDAMTDWVCLTDLESRILRTNRVGEEFAGVPLAELVGQICCQFIHGTEGPLPGCPLQKMCRSCQQETMEFQSPDGNRWLRVTVDPVTDEEGNLVGAVHIVRDITARILAEEELHRLTEELLLEKEKLEDIIRGVGAGLALLDLETRIVWANETLQDWFGPLEEIAGRVCCELYESAAPQEECIALRTLHSGQMEHGETFAHDVQGERRYFQIVTMPLKDKDGRIEQLVELTLDITARQQAEEALRESEQKFRSVIEQSSDGISLIDEQGTIIEWNRGQEQIFGLPRAEVLGQPAWAVHEQLKASVLELLRTGQVSQLDRLFEREIQRPDGQRRVVQTLVFPIEVDQRVMVGSVSRDITELKQAEETLERRAAQLALLNDVGGRIAATLDLDDVLDRAASLVQESFGYHHVALFTVDRQRDELVMRARAGDFAHLFPPDHRLAMEQGIVGWVGHHGETLLVSDVDAEPRYVNLYPDQVPTRSELSVPIRVAGEIVGVLDVQSLQLDAFDENDVLVMETLADQVAVALENARLFEVVARGKREWETTFDAMTDWVCLVDLEGRVLRTNRVGEKFAGVSLAGIVGQKCCKLVHNSENPLPECPLQRMCQTHQRESLKFQAPDGNRWLMAAVDPVTDAEGNLIGAVYTVRDVTERERAEQELHLLATMVEQSTDSIIYTDTAFRITYVNKATEELFGWRLDELRGKTPDLFNAEPLADEIQARIYTTVAAGGTYQDEALNVRKDGSTFHCQFRVSPLYDESGAIYGYMGSQRDVTARKRAEEELRTLSSVVEQSASAIAIIDLEGNVEYANPTFLEWNDFSPEQIVGQNWRTFLSTSSSLRERYPEIQDTVVQRGALWREEITDRTKGGKAIWREATIFPIKDANGAITHSVYASVDITARKQAEEALRERNRELALLNRAGQALSATLDLEQVLVTVLDETRQLLGVTACSVWLIDPETGEPVCQQSSGPHAEVVRGWRLAPGQGLVGWAAHSGESLSVPDAQADERYFRGVDERTGILLRSVISVPLQIHEDVIGVLQVVDAEAARFSPTDLTLTESLATTAAAAIENARLFEQAQQEIAEREQVQEALQESEEKFRNLVEQSSDGIVLVDEQGAVIEWNQGQELITGLKQAEVLGQPFWDVQFQATLEEQKTPALREQISAALLDFLKTGQVPWLNQVLERDIQRPDGSRRTIQSSVFPIETSKGFMIGTISRDVTERKRTEKELKRRNEELAALNAIVTAASQYLDLNDILDAALRETLTVLNAEGGLIFLFDETSQSFTLAAHRKISREMLQGVTGFQLAEGLSGQVAQTGQPLLVPDLTQDPRIAASAAVREEWRSVAIAPLRAKVGTVGVMTIGGHTKGQFTSESLDLLTSIGRQIGMAVENARLVEEAAEIEILRELDRLRSELIANVSHELRTPLGLIKVFSTILLSEDVDLDSETQRECLQDIDEETDRLEAIVDNLLDLSRLRDERLRLDKHPTDLGRLAREVVESMEVQLTHHRLVLDFPVAPLMATVDPGRIAQVLRNLLDNAVKYSPEGRTITVQGRAEDEQRILVGVSDEGIGIPTQELEKVFERFHRVENEVTQRVRGAGLGLAVCRGIVAAHDGHIWAESTLGVGSTFYFTLPVGAESVIP